MKKIHLHQYLAEVEDRMATTGRTVPQWRAAFRQGYTFSARPFAEQMEIWDHVWKQTTRPITRIQPFFFLESIMRKEDKLLAAWDTIVTWQEEVDDWAYCDAMSKIYTKVLELAPKKVYPKLKQWNKDPNLWKRRQSVVSLLYYAGTKKVIPPFQDITALIHPLLGDGEYYVQKGVGWALRELHTAYPEEGFQYLHDNIRSVSGRAFSAASEKLSPQQKALLKSIRR